MEIYSENYQLKSRDVNMFELLPVKRTVKK